MTTLLQFRTQMRDILGDPLATSTTFSDTQLNDAVNHAILKYCQITGATYKEASATTDSSGIAAMPSSAIRAVRVITTTAGQLDKSEVAQEDYRNPTWRSQTGTPSRWVPWDGNSVRVVPIASSASVTIGYVEAPAALSVDGNSPDSRIPIGHHDWLTFEAVAFALLLATDKKDIEESQYFTKKFMELVATAVMHG